MAGKLTLACRDIGMDCGFVAAAKGEEKLMKKASKHLRKKHKILEITPDLMAKAKSAVKKSM